MFNLARLKLTLWYLLIIMSISVSFSFFIYQLLQNEIKRIALVQLEQIDTNYDFEISQNPTGLRMKPVPLGFDQEILNDSRRRLTYVLLIVNGTILVISGGLGYLLAGETLKPIQDMVEDQNRFISDASHELRTPLTALKSTMEVNIRDPHLTLKEARTLIEESIDEVDKLHKLSEDLLQLARSKHTAEAPYFKELRLDKIIHQANKKVSAMASKKKIKIINHTPKITLQAIDNTLEQAVVIVLDNAIKYSAEKSRIDILASESKGWIELSITDHGSGIARKDIPHIFDRFYRTDSARSKADAGGYGLGLSIAQQIVIAHHGRIEVQSRVKKGTTITFLLPKTQAHLS